MHLASVAKVGTKVKVLQAYAGGISENAPLSSLFSFGSSEESAASPANAKRKTPLAKKPASVPAKKAAAE